MGHNIAQMSYVTFQLPLHGVASSALPSLVTSGWLVIVKDSLCFWTSNQRGVHSLALNSGEARPHFPDCAMTWSVISLPE